MSSKFRVLDANGVGLQLGDRVAWAASAGGRKKPVKRATIAAMLLNSFDGGSTREVVVQAAIDGGLKDSVKAFLEPMEDSVVFTSITKI